MTDAAFVRAIDAAMASGALPPPAPVFAPSQWLADLAALCSRNDGWDGAKPPGVVVASVATYRTRSKVVRALPPALRAQLDELACRLFLFLPAGFVEGRARADPMPAIATLHVLNEHLVARNNHRVRVQTSA